MDFLSAAWPYFLCCRWQLLLSLDGKEEQKQEQAAASLVKWTEEEYRIGEMEDELWKLRRKVEDNEKMEAFRDMMDSRKADTLVEREKRIVELEKKLEDTCKVRNSLFDVPQVDGTSEAPGSDFKGWGALKGNQIMRRTVVVKLESGEGVARATFLDQLDSKLGLGNLKALGTAGNNKEWHITLKSIEHAESLVSSGPTIQGKSAKLEILSPSTFRVRLFWLPFHVDNEDVKVWFATMGIKVKEIRMEKSALSRIKHVATLTREIICSGVHAEGARDRLPDVGTRRFRVLVTVQGRPAKCHKCGERGHMRRSCTYCVHCRSHTHDFGDFPERRVNKPDSAAPTPDYVGSKVRDLEEETTSVATIAISNVPSAREAVHTSQKATTSAGSKLGVKRGLTETPEAESDGFTVQRSKSKKKETKSRLQ